MWGGDILWISSTRWTFQYMYFNLCISNPVPNPLSSYVAGTFAVPWELQSTVCGICQSHFRFWDIRLQLTFGVFGSQGSPWLLMGSLGAPTNLWESLNNSWSGQHLVWLEALQLSEVHTAKNDAVIWNLFLKVVLQVSITANRKPFYQRSSWFPVKNTKF